MVISLVNDGAELLLLYTPVLKLVLRTIFNWVLKKVLDYEKKTDNQLLTMSIRWNIKKNKTNKQNKKTKTKTKTKTKKQKNKKYFWI